MNLYPSPITRQLLLFVLIFFYIFGNFSILAQELSNNENVKEELKNNKITTDKIKEKYKETKDLSKASREDKQVGDNGFPRLFIGPSIGTPTGANFHASYYTSNFVIRGQGMYFNNNWNGGQLDIGWVFQSTRLTALSFSLVGGGFRVDPIKEVPHNNPNTLLLLSQTSDPLIQSYILNDRFERRNLSQSYIGLTFDVQMSNFFFQVGAGSGRGDYSNPQLLFQMGYFYRIY